MITLGNIKIAIVAILLVIAIWFYKDWEFQKAENIRQTENTKQLLYKDSVHSAYLLLSDKEFREYIERTNKLKAVIADLRIKKSRVNTIYVHDVKYKDTSKRITKVPELDSPDFTYPLLDSTSCLTIKGNIKFIDNVLSVEILEREFNNTTTVIGYWQRRQWSFLGIKTRFLGKVESVVETANQCGESQILNIKKKK
jgi:hypothetical protein